jgi:hypothetical protein
MTVAGLIIALPSTYFYISGNSLTCPGGECADTTTSSLSHIARVIKDLSAYENQNPLNVRLSFPASRSTNRQVSTFVVQVLHSTFENAILLFISAGNRLGIDVRRVWGLLQDRWTPRFPLSRLVSVAITTALPGAFLVFTRAHPESWAARRQTQIANALHILTLVTVANPGFSVQDLLVAALVMVSFETLRGSLNRGSSEASATLDTLLLQTHAVVAKSDFVPSAQRRKKMGKSEDKNDASSVLTTGTKEEGECSSIATVSSSNEEISHLQETLTVTKTSEKAKDHELRRAQKELKNARDTLSETFAEYASLRDEMKTMKQTLGRDHQVIIYRKDIELFALRKASEQKESYIKECESKLEDVHRQQRTTLELKDAQIRNLKNRIMFLERQHSPSLDSNMKVDSGADTETQDAVQVRLLRVKGRNSSEIEAAIEEKETEIAALKTELAKASSACGTLAKTQMELRRAWDSVFEVQNMLNEERQRHLQTENRLQEASTRLEEEFKTRTTKNSLTALPTIDEQDKHELEAMFNTAQEDNLRLYTEVEALEKRVREANARVFISEQEAEALTEQLRLEKAINEDMETARPSLVHRVHFQRMEGQLKESRDQLAEKEIEIQVLKKSVGEKEAKFVQLENDKDATATSQSKLREENEQLKRTVADMEATKQQLMLDHERLAQHRARQRNSSADHASARSSATPFTDAQVQTVTSDEPLPARPVTNIPTPTHMPSTSIQNTPERHLRSDPQKLSMISNDLPPPELRGVRRKSLTLKGLMKKFVRKDEMDEELENDNSTTKKETKDRERPRTALMPKNRNVLMRPRTAVPTPSSSTMGALHSKRQGINNEKNYHASGSNGKDDVQTSTSVTRPKVQRTTTPRYYATHPDGRPMTAAPTTGDIKVKEGAKKTEHGVLRPLTAAPMSREAALKDSDVERKQEAARPKTAAPVADASESTMIADKPREEANVKKPRPKSWGWQAS